MCKSHSLLLSSLISSLLASTTLAQDCCQPTSWVFKRSTFTNDPETGARVAQYQRHAPVEELPDPRLVTSGYRRTRTNLIGTDGSSDSYYQVQSWGNGRGGLDAEWERFHDAWRQSYLSGSYYSGSGYFYGNPGFDRRRYDHPGYGPGFDHRYGSGPGYDQGPQYGYRPPMYSQGGPAQGPYRGPLRNDRPHPGLQE